MKFRKGIMMSVLFSMIILGCKSEAQEVKKALISKTITDLKKSEISDPEYVKGEILVRFSKQADMDRSITELEKFKGVSFIKMLMDSKDVQIAHFSVPIGEELTFIDVFSKNKDIAHVELNRGGTFIEPVIGSLSTDSNNVESLGKSKVVAKSSLGDRILGIWEVKNEYYMAVYEIQRYKDYYVGLVHYYNDGKDEIKGDGSKDFYFLENVKYNQSGYEGGVMHMPDGSQYDVILYLKNENQLEAKMTIEGQPYTEIWIRKNQ